MLPVKVSLNIKDEQDGEHLRLIVVAVIKPGAVALCYLFVLSFSCFMSFMYARTCVCPYFVPPVAVFFY